MFIFIKEPTIIKSKPVQSNLLGYDEKINLLSGNKIECESITNGGHNHWVAKTKLYARPYFFYKPHVVVDWGNLITFKHFRESFVHAKQSDIHTYFSPFNQTLVEFQINTVQRIAAFCAQIAHETCSLKYKEEIASGQAYEGRKDLGNVYPGDGRRYKGRGLIQLTGRHNYTWASKQLGVDLVNNPQLALQPLNSCRIAGLYWHSRNLNKYADWHSVKGLRIITKKINGGLNGWRDRQDQWNRIKKVLYC